MKIKQCKECLKIKSINDFYGIQGECKECTKKRIKKSSKNIIRKCLICKKEFGTCIAEIKRSGGKYCSRKCYYKSKEGINAYNFKGKNGCNNGYDYIHTWIAKKLGSPKYCEHCKTTKAKMYHWSNISGKYLEDVRDWQRLCVKCHSKYDIEKRKEIIINCVVCGKKIKTKSKKRKFCSMKCINKYYRNLNKKHI